MTTVSPDPKPSGRHVATRTEWAEIIAAKIGPCRGCGSTGNHHLHHLVPRGAGGSGGDDVPENIAPLCPDCHRALHDHPPGWEQTAANVRASLTLPELTYIRTKKSADWLDRYLPAVCSECKRPLTDTPGGDSQPSQAPAAARRKRSDANTSYLRLRIPDGARENGRETLETLIGEARDLIGRPEWSDPYYVLVEVLAVFVRDAHKEPAGV